MARSICEVSLSANPSAALSSPKLLAKARRQSLTTLWEFHAPVPPLSIAEEIYEREGDADCGDPADENPENSTSERPLSRGVRGDDLRPLYVLILWRRLNVVQVAHRES